MSPKMKESGKRKGYAYLLALFFAFLFVCSLCAKGIYAAGLPQVETTFPISTSLRHEFNLEGSIVKGDERAQYVLSGLRVEKVFVRMGDLVHVGDPLFQVDVENAKELAEKLELDIHRQKLQIQDLQADNELKSRREAMQKQRADEDYKITLEEGTRQTAGAADNLEKAKAELEEHLNAKPSAPEGTVSGADTVSGGNSFSYEQKLEVWESEKKALEEKVQSLEQAEMNTRYASDKALLNASRAVEDAELFADTDSTWQMYQMNLQELEKEYEKYDQICNKDGMVLCEWDGILTTLAVSVGEKITDGPVAKVTDPSGEFLFKTSVGQDTLKYIGQGDEAVLRLNGSSRELSVRIGYMTENEYIPGSYDAFVVLQETGAVPGTGGILSVRMLSECFSYCIPLEALIYAEEDRGYSIYVMDKKNGILGSQLIVRKVKVKVLERNETYAAIESALVDETSEVVINHTKQLADGSVVRYREW